MKLSRDEVRKLEILGMFSELCQRGRVEDAHYSAYQRKLERKRRAYPFHAERINSKAREQRAAIKAAGGEEYARLCARWMAGYTPRCQLSPTELEHERRRVREYARRYRARRAALRSAS